jgi:hypothetical protein
MAATPMVRCGQSRYETRVTVVTLEEARRIVLASCADDWYQVDAASQTPEGHQFEATYRDDVMLRMVWGRTCTEQFDQPWRARFPDASARSFYVEIMYGASIIDRSVVVSADGGRYVLPLGALHQLDDHSYEVHVTMADEALARLLHELVQCDLGYRFEDGMRGARMRRV